MGKLEDEVHPYSVMAMLIQKEKAVNGGGVMNTHVDESKTKAKFPYRAVSIGENPIVPDIRTHAHYITVNQQVKILPAIDDLSTVS